MSKQPNIEAIGQRAFVWGMRGDWDVFIPLTINGQYHEASVRSSPYSRFESLSYRDDARDVRDSVQTALANGEFVYVYCPALGTTEIVKIESRKFGKFPLPHKAALIVWNRAA